MLLKEDTLLIFHIDVRSRYQESEKDNIRRRWIVERTNCWHNRFRKLL